MWTRWCLHWRRFGPTPWASPCPTSTSGGWVLRGTVGLCVHCGRASRRGQRCASVRRRRAPRFPALTLRPPAAVPHRTHRTVTSKFNELVYQYPIRIPERYSLVIRSLLTQVRPAVERSGGGGASRCGCGCSRPSAAPPPKLHPLPRPHLRPAGGHLLDPRPRLPFPRGQPGLPPRPPAPRRAARAPVCARHRTRPGLWLRASPLASPLAAPPPALCCAVPQVAYPYVARRLLTDEDPALRTRLFQVRREWRSARSATHQGCRRRPGATRAPAPAQLPALSSRPPSLARLLPPSATPHPTPPPHPHPTHNTGAVPGRALPVGPPGEPAAPGQGGQPRRPARRARRPRPVHHCDRRRPRGAAGRPAAPPAAQGLHRGRPPARGRGGAPAAPRAGAWEARDRGRRVHGRGWARGLACRAARA